MTFAIALGRRRRRSWAPLSLPILFSIAVIALTIAISLAGRWLGHTIALGGHTDDQTVHEIVIGNNVVAAPANMIRYARDRRSGIAERLELYMNWPDLGGYSAETSAAFNNLEANGSIIFLTFEPRMMSRDMSARFEPIYRTLIEQPGKPGPGDVTFYRFKSDSGYVEEELAVASRQGDTPFVARCLKGEQARQLLAQCQRDVILSEDLSLTYRFPISLLSNWRALDDAITERVRQMLRTGGRQ
ncbi:MAG: hypothetical protein M9924_16545 [Rhizobiaceae bacterium]|nr:hypothetical protein [Rhizobiaceae bacterium]